MWHCPFDVSFAAHTPQWERVLLPEEIFVVDGRSRGQVGIRFGVYGIW